MRAIIPMEDKYKISSLELIEAVFTDYENAQEAKVTRALAEEIRSMRYYVPELELIMVDEDDMPIGYCMFSRFALEGKHDGAGRIDRYFRSSRLQRISGTFVKSAKSEMVSSATYAMIFA